ncbi:MAG: 50S ribosomal protein L10 [Deltaproteobacteria bacterium]|nr:MAG: 50S ribosomal protein L10 [Deltaproteobacteria bacterium]
MDRRTKEEKIKDLQEKLQQVQAIILTDYRGLNVGEITQLRRELEKVEAQYLVVKNTLLKLAIQGTELELDEEQLMGPNALALCFGDPIVTLRTLRNFIKNNQLLEIKGGAFPGRVLRLPDIDVLGGLRNREALLARLLNSLIHPLRRGLAVLSGPQRRFVQVLQAIVESNKN